jgi:hypothetical protein
MHTHPWRYTIVLGLWGSYVERRYGREPVLRRAPYLYVMDSSVIHQVMAPSPGHTSVIIGIGRDDSLRSYYAADVVETRTLEEHNAAMREGRAEPLLRRVGEHLYDHDGWEA